MITIDKLKIYKKYNGDADMWAREDNEENKMSESDWHLIDSLLQDLAIFKNSYGSNDFAEKFDERLKQNFNSKLAIDFLMSLSK